ncbi:IS1634 family transposase [Rickettsiales endosymbiont of Peranema trichophorum]|uniref:IS1634 family transposase n=1 Tax=Rickettsiales endosymbiont of Peranema trichophorum TaxID=2486577 RepID=UPI001023399B|nr:IS1634 family transposase [Rickettsiales endosymbiont of Peranema trichophorum]RZI47510.1 IS1634 family transposase [Rickettsiales endosymbiont of Peranema trichophorum]
MAYGKEKIHLEIQTNTSKNPVGILRSSYRENGKIKHKQYGRITGKTLQELKLLQLAFRGQVLPGHAPEALRIIQSKEYGASAALLQVIKSIHLDKVIYSRNEPWVAAALTMIAGRILYAGSKLSLCNQYDNTCLFELMGIEGRPDVERHCYIPLDELLARQDHIQKSLAKQYLADGHLVLYDITSSYLEGAYNESELAAFGYNRDKKSGHKQIVIGLICNKAGCPVAVEVFPGNTKDESTVIDKVRELKDKYCIKEVIFVGDRGMLTKSNLEKLSTADVPATEMNEEEVVGSYKDLSLVEQSFRSLKTVHLEMRPIYHHIEQRIKGHIFLCMLAYHVQWHMKERLKALFSVDGRGKYRRWSFEGVLETLKSITRNRVLINEVEVIKHSEPTTEQAYILELLSRC